MKKPSEPTEKHVQLVKARFHVNYKKRTGTARFRWSDRSTTEREVASVAEYLELLTEVYAKDLQKPDGM